MHDVIVIGAGPVGLACALETQRQGLTTRVIEKGALVNSLTGYPTGMEFFSTPELLEIGGHPFATQRYKPTREEALDYYRRVADAEELDLCLYETVEQLDGRDGDFRVQTDKDTHRARKVIIAVGFFDVPNLMDVPGEELPKVKHYFREPYAYAHQDVLVVGGANSATKAALHSYRSGARVTLAVRERELSEGVKYWLRPDLENRLAEGAIDAHFKTLVERITEDTVTLNTPDGPLTIDNDWVLAMTGYRPDYDLLENRLGIEAGDDPARTPIYDEDSFETRRPGVHIAGTVCGGLNTSRWFIENGRHHAKQIATHLGEAETTAAAPAL